MASAKIIVRSNKKMANGLYPVVIRLAHLKLQSTYIRLKGLACTDKEWNNELSRFTPTKENYKLLNTNLHSIESRVDTIVEKLESENNFSYTKFKELFFLKNNINKSVSKGYQQKIDELLQQQCYGTATFYKSSLTAIQEYTKNTKLCFEDINYSFLNGFVNHEIIRGIKSNSIAVYLKGLRSIHYSHCKINDLPMPSVYSRIGIQSLIKPTRKRSLTSHTLRQLMDYIPRTKHEDLAKDIFLFSFYCRGINLMDIAKLNNDNIVNGRIEYTRSKTHGLFSIAITPEIEKILSKHNVLNNSLFPIVKSDIPVRNAVKNYTKTLNRNLNRISTKLNFTHDLTLYYARHTFAQLSRENGVSIEQISRALGHTDLKTTEVYLKSFANTELDDISKKIMKNLK